MATVHLKTKIRSFRKIKRLVASLSNKVTPKRIALGGVALLALVAVLQAALFYWPRSLEFSYSGGNCFVSPQLLPKLVSSGRSRSFDAVHSDSFTILGYPLYSYRTCVDAVDPPSEYSSEAIALEPLGLGLLKKNLRVTNGGFPSIQNPIKPGQLISTQKPLVFPLDRIDKTFAYELSANKRGQACNLRNDSIICEVEPLRLAQSKRYTFALKRMFKDQLVEVAVEQTAITVKPVRITGSSIKAGQTVFKKPKSIKLKLNKPAASVEGAVLVHIQGKQRKQLPITTQIKGASVSIIFDKQLPRHASFELKLETIAATDDAFLQKPYVLPFKTSGGPKVLGVNIGTYSVSPSAYTVITFDSPVDSKSASKFVSLEVGGQKVASSLSVDSKTIVITPTTQLGLCVPFTVKVSDGLNNEYGVSGGSAWSYSSRTICHTVFSIGTSVQGRSITAYRFGSGPSRIVFVGGTHGDEKSSVYTLNSLVEDLEASGGGPAHRTVTIIPNLNPDGFAAGSRTNARGVDLNRNFPANDWKKDVTMPGGSLNKGGGGSKPLSEPESSALAGYVLGQNPRLVLTYHAVAGVVIPNDSGNSVSLAQTYARNSNLNFASNSQTGAIFQYDTTGAFEDWLHDKHGIPTLLIELWTKSANEFSGNVKAILAMIQ